MLRTCLRFELLRAQCVPSDDPDGVRSRAEWGAAAGGVAGEAVRPRALRIRGVPARALRRVEVRDAGRAVFVLDSIVDASGRVTSAGSMLEAMAAMAGRAGLEIDLAGQRPGLPSIVVRLEIAAYGGASAGAISIEAILG